MLDILVVCPHCGGTVLIDKNEFTATMPVVDEEEVEARVMCPCGMYLFDVQIALEPLLDEDDGEPDGLTIGHVALRLVPVAN
jgi:hypothetical protein